MPPAARAAALDPPGGNDSPRTPSERRPPRLRRAVRRPVGVRRLLGESLTYPLCVFQIIPVPITKVLGEGGVGFEEGATFLQKGSLSPPPIKFLTYPSRRGRSCGSWCVLSYNNDIYGVCSGKQCWLLCGDISILWWKRVLKGKNCVNYYYNFMYDTCDSADSFWTCVLYSSYENDKHAR